MSDTPICHDCGCHEGELHSNGCDMESCPFCGGQLISCSCCYEKLGFPYDSSAPTCGLPEEIYNNGLPDDLQDKWVEILGQKGRFPYVVYPNLCVKCSRLWPEMFQVPDEEWERYIEPAQRGKMICPKCWDYIKRVSAEALAERHNLAGAGQTRTPPLPTGDDTYGPLDRH